MIFVKDAKELRFVRFNKAGESLLGYRRSDLLGKNDYDFFPKEQADYFTSNDKQVLEAKAVTDYPCESIQTKAGVRYLHTKKIPILAPNGDPLYLLGISFDITEKKQMEEQRLELIREQAARHEAEQTAAHFELLSSIKGSLTGQLDLDTLLNSFAKSLVNTFCDWCQIHLFKDEQHPLEKTLVRHSDEAKIEWAENWNRINDPHKKILHRIAKSLQDNKPRLFSQIKPEEIESIYRDIPNYSEIKNQNIRSVLILPILRDQKLIGTITFVKSGEGRLYNLRDLAMAEDFTQTLSSAIENTYLFYRAHAANRAKSAFLANISHEIRTPLGVILGFSELMLDDGLSEEHKTYVAAVIRNGKQLLEIVDEVLDLAKAESNRISIEEIPFVLPELISDVTSLLQVKAQEKDLSLKVHIEGEIPEEVISDPTRIRQILINLGGNAIKFTESGEVAFYISLIPSETQSEEHTLRIRVVDTGIGIPEEHKDRLFHPFSQADSSMTRRFGGTGLGLFLARKFARLLNGDLVLESSQPNRGSTFCVSVKIKVPNA